MCVCIYIYSPVTAVGSCREGKRKAFRLNTATGENVIERDGGSRRSDGYVGIGELQIGALMLTPPSNISG